MLHFFKKSLFFCFLLIPVFLQLNGEYLASGYARGTIAIWDINKKPGEELIKTLDGKNGCIYSVKFSPFNENILASGERNNRVMGPTAVKIWDISKEKGEELIKTLKGHQNIITSVDFSPFYPNILASGSHDGTIKIWDTNKKPGEELIMTLDGEGGTVYDIKFSPFDKNILASGSADGVIKIWNINKKPGEELINTITDKGQTSSIAFNHFDKDILASSVYQGGINIWNISKKRNGQNLINSFSGNNIQPHDLVQQSLVFSQLRPNILIAGGRQIIIYDLSDLSLKSPQSKIYINTRGTPLAFSSLNKNILAAGSLRMKRNQRLRRNQKFWEIRIFDISKAKNYSSLRTEQQLAEAQKEKFLIKTLKGKFDDPVSCLAFSNPTKKITEQEKEDLTTRTKFNLENEGLKNLLIDTEKYRLKKECDNQIEEIEEKMDNLKKQLEKLKKRRDALKLNKK